jgi:hypothetical protein
MHCFFLHFIYFSIFYLDYTCWNRQGVEYQESFKILNHFVTFFVAFSKYINFTWKIIFLLPSDTSWFDEILNIFLWFFSFETARRQSYKVDNIGGTPEAHCGVGDSGASGDGTNPTGETPTESDRRGRGFEPRHWKKTYCQEHSKPIIFRITWSRPKPERNWATAQWVIIFSIVFLLN